MNFPRLLLTTCIVVGLSACATDTTPDNELLDAVPVATGTLPNVPAQEPLVGTFPARLNAGNVGAYMQDLQKEIEQALSEGQAKMEIEPLADNQIKLTASNEASFDFDRSDAQPEFLAHLDRLVPALLKYSQTAVTVVGHTDATGGAFYNRDISKRRAESVRNHLQKMGIAAERLSLEGRGEDQPRASNATDEGRQQNRRVEIFLRPIL